jgi:hypothetical protein
VLRDTVQPTSTSGSFLPLFEQHIATRVGNHRSGGFRAILRAAEQHAAQSGKPMLVVETGGLRQLENWLGDGQSTRIFDAFVGHHKGFLFSVDINPICAVLVRQICSDRTVAVTADSIQFLQAFQGKHSISVLYLDSFDLDVRNPEPSSRHHLEELTTVIDFLEPGTVIAVDDNTVVDGKPVGKGYLVESFLADRGVPLVFDGYQKVWQVPVGLPKNR